MKKRNISIENEEEYEGNARNCLYMSGKSGVCKVPLVDLKHMVCKAEGSRKYKRDKFLETLAQKI